MQGISTIQTKTLYYSLLSNPIGIRLFNFGGVGAGESAPHRLFSCRYGNDKFLFIQRTPEDGKQAVGRVYGD